MRAIARLVGNDPARIDAIFRRSGLMREKWDRQDYREATIAKALEAPPQAPPRDSPDAPVVMLTPEECRVIDDTIGALKADPDLFCRGPVLARVVRSATPTEQRHIKRVAGVSVIADVPPANLRDRMTRHARFQRVVKGQIVDAHPPGWLVGVEARANWPGFRELVGVSATPILREDGTVCQSTGFDPATGVLVELGRNFPAVPESPTLREAQGAAAELLDVVADFPFLEPCHSSAWLASVLTLVGRFAFEGPCPLFLVDANVRGAGKGKLCEAASLIATGLPAAVTTMCGDQDELRKRITASIMAGDRMVLLDNLDSALGNGTLDAMLTSTHWKDRLLGVNRQVCMPNMAVWFATGNNVQVVADTARRVVHIRLDVKVEHPEDRGDFRHKDLIGFVQSNHPRLLIAGLTILRAYCAAGMPDQGLKPMGSFEGWSGLIRGAVVWLGLVDPCEGRDGLEQAADPEVDALGDLLRLLAERDAGGQGFVLGELLAKLYAAEPPLDDNSVGLRTAIEAMVGPSGNAAVRTPDARRLAKKLRHYKGRVKGGLRLECDPRHKRRAGVVWVVVRVEGGAIVRPCDSVPGRCEIGAGGGGIKGVGAKDSPPLPPRPADRTASACRTTSRSTFPDRPEPESHCRRIAVERWFSPALPLIARRRLEPPQVQRRLHGRVARVRRRYGLVGQRPHEPRDHRGREFHAPRPFRPCGLGL